MRHLSSVGQLPAAHLPGPAIKWPDAVEFVQLNVFGPDLINDFLVGGSAVYGGAINPSLDSRRANALDAPNGFWAQPFKILI